MTGTTPSCFCRFPDAFVNNDNKRFGPKVAAVKFYNHMNIRKLSPSYNKLLS